MRPVKDKEEESAIIRREKEKTLTGSQKEDNGEGSAITEKERKGNE